MDRETAIKLAKERQQAKSDLDREIKEGYVHTSEGERISLRQAKHHFNSKIGHLPTAEQEKLDSLYRSYRSYIGKKAHERDEDGLRKQDKMAMYKNDIVELFGRMFSVEDVKQCCEERWGFKVSATHLNNFRLKYADVIAEKIEHHKRNHWELRLSHKRSRIEELSEVFYKLKDEFLKLLRPTQAQVLTQILEAIRKETDGDILTVNGVFDVNINAVVQHHLKQEILKTVDLKSLILARVAAKTNTDINVLSYALFRSYYKTLNGISDAAIIEEFPMPSTQPYDFNAIEANNSIRAKEEATLLTQPLNTLGNTDMINDFRDKLLSKTTEQLDIIQRKQAAINAIDAVKSLSLNKSE